MDGMQGMSTPERRASQSVQSFPPLRARTLIPFCLGIAAAGGVYFLKALRQPSRGDELPQHRSSLASYTAAEHGVYQYEPQQDYVAALAQTRQTAHIEKASAFQSDGEPARWVEMRWCDEASAESAISMMLNARIGICCYLPADNTDSLHFCCAQSTGGASKGSA